MRHLRCIPFVIAVSILSIISCKKDKAVPQAINYYDFPDVVVRYPYDSSAVDSVSFALASGSQNDLTVFASFNNYFGAPDSIYTNKFISISSNSSYELEKRYYNYCCDVASLNNLIYPSNLNASFGHGDIWTHYEFLFSNVNFVGVDQNCYPGINEFYIPIRNTKDNEHYAGWIRGLLSTDSLVLYDCAFSEQPHLSIRAGQH